MSPGMLLEKHDPVLPPFSVQSAQACQVHTALESYDLSILLQQQAVASSSRNIEQPGRMGHPCRVSEMAACFHGSGSLA